MFMDFVVWLAGLKYLWMDVHLYEKYTVRTQQKMYGRNN